MSKGKAAKKVGVYAGSFNPITNGHLDIIGRARQIVDHLIVAVAHNSAKPAEPFAIDERVALIEKSLDRDRNDPLPGDASVEVTSFTRMLLVEFVKTHKARFIIRGLRGSSDFDFESNLTGINYELDDKIDTIFLMASPRMLYVSSSMVREIAMNRGPVGRFVPACVDEALKRKYGAPSGRTKTMKQPRDLPGE